MAAHPLQQPLLSECRPPVPRPPPAQYLLAALVPVAAQTGRHHVGSHGDTARCLGYNMIQRLGWGVAVGASVPPGLEYSPPPAGPSDQQGPVDQRLHLQRSAGPRLDARPPILAVLPTKPKLTVKFSFVGESQAMEPLALTASQEFEIERFSRAIDATGDVATLRAIAKQLLQAWMT